MPHPLVDGNRVRRRSQLRIASSKHLGARLHDLQVQTTRETIASIVCQQVLKEQILYRYISFSIISTTYTHATYQVGAEIRRSAAASHKAVYFDRTVETVRKVKYLAANGDGSDGRKRVSVCGQG